MDIKYIEDDNDIRCREKCKCCFSWKRFFLPISALLPSLIYYDKFRNDPYIFVSVFISSSIVFWNFPSLSRLGYTKPVYFEDLNENNKKIIKRKIMSNIELSKKFQNRFIYIQQLILATTISLIVDYAVQRYQYSTQAIAEVLGSIGGLISLYIKLTRFLGRMLLSFLYYIKKREKEKLLKKIKKDKDKPTLVEVIRNIDL